MEIKITFNELRNVKDQLPKGSIGKLSKEFNVSEEEIRNYFGGTHYEKGSVGIHTEPGPNGGIVQLDDSSIFERAKEIISNSLVSNKY